VNLASVTGDYYAIPVVTMAPEHRELIARLLAHGRRVRIWINVRNEVSSGAVETANVIGEVRGALHPEETVLLTAHLDSWDLGQGATDDGFGVAAVLAAAEAIMNAGQRPARTIRFAFFTGEEQGLRGSLAYVKTHPESVQTHVAVICIDMGDGAPNGLLMNGRSDLVPPLQEIAPFIAAGRKLKVSDSMFMIGDSFTFTLNGIAAIDFSQDSTDLRYTHHSIGDTFDKVKPENLVSVSLAAATLSWCIANGDSRLSTPRTPAQVQDLLMRMHMTTFAGFVKDLR
jgi:Zn-dependent M28 family amino/carboxypeptidase